MTNEDFCNLQAQMHAASVPEAMTMIELMAPMRLAQFAQRLSLSAAYPFKNEAVWRYMANVLAAYYEELLQRIGGDDNPCLDPLNSECECPHCEAVSAEEEPQIGPDSVFTYRVVERKETGQTA